MRGAVAPGPQGRIANWLAISVRVARPYTGDLRACDAWRSHPSLSPHGPTSAAPDLPPPSSLALPPGAHLPRPPRSTLPHTYPCRSAVPLHPHQVLIFRGPRVRMGLHAGIHSEHDICTSKADGGRTTYRWVPGWAGAARVPVPVALSLHPLHGDCAHPTSPATPSLASPILIEPPRGLLCLRAWLGLRNAMPYVQP